MFKDINDDFKSYISFLPYIPKKNENFNKFRGHVELGWPNCNPSLELRDITHAQYTCTHLFTCKISELGRHSLQSYGCVRITF